MSDCVFCKIVAWELPCVKIWEDDDFLAILDAFPNTKWMTLLMPKNHYDSDIFKMDDDMYTKYMLAAKKLIPILEKWLEVNRVAVVMEGMWVDHAHIKFYPLHGLDKKREEYRSQDQIYFDNYEWYITTKTWPRANMEVLEQVAQQIISAN